MISYVLKIYTGELRNNAPDLNYELFIRRKS